MMRKADIWPTLPSHYYFDAARYEQELEQIWYRNWLYIGRAHRLADPRSFCTFRIGSQNILIVRDEQGELQAFHNTCRHRGSMLCTEAAGQLTKRRIVCPYHQWSYTLQGKLVGVPFIGQADRLTDVDLSLYGVAVQEWAGCIFVKVVGGEERPLAQAADPPLADFDHWPLADLVVGHTFQTTIQCNWKIFWENYMECYHCPGVHPELCELVPLYKQALSSKVVKTKKEPASPGVRAGAQTWSMDGLIHGNQFTGLNEEERVLGYKFLTCLPTMFMVAHPDYVRIVSLLPLSPETTQLTAEWLFSASTLRKTDFDLKNVTDFATLVMEQDAKVCELNQRGLRSRRHQHGVLVPHEVEVYRFQQWVQREMGQEA